MRFAYSKSKNAEFTMQAAAALAKRCRFDAMELNGNDFVRTDVEIAQRIFQNAQVEIVAINFGGEFGGLAESLEIAAALKCRNIRVKCDRFLDRSGVLISQAIKNLTQAGDVAADFGIMILLENQSTQGSAVRLWRILDRLNHPAIACAWNAANGVLAGDNPAVAIPTLNLRIRYVELNLDDPAIPARKTLDRLRGVGFDGFTLINAANHANFNEWELEQSLIRAHASLQKWQILPTAAT